MIWNWFRIKQFISNIGDAIIECNYLSKFSVFLFHAISWLDCSICQHFSIFSLPQMIKHGIKSWSLHLWRVVRYVCESFIHIENSILVLVARFRVNLFNIIPYLCVWSGIHVLKLFSFIFSYPIQCHKHIFKQKLLKMLFLKI